MFILLLLLCWVGIGFVCAATVILYDYLVYKIKPDTRGISLAIVMCLCGPAIVPRTVKCFIEIMREEKENSDENIRRKTKKTE